MLSFRHIAERSPSRSLQIRVADSANVIQTGPRALLSSEPSAESLLTDLWEPVGQCKLGCYASGVAKLTCTGHFCAGSSKNQALQLY